MGGVTSGSLCDWLDGKYPSFVLGWIVPKLFKYTNLNRTCPYDGYIYFKVSNISVDEFSFPQALPAGRYRVNVNFKENEQQNLFNLTGWFSVSDHRIEIV